MVSVIPSQTSCTDYSNVACLFWEQYRSPEEFAKQDLDEKIDVFTFGNNIYALVRPT
jgi:hypothetical protein